MNVPYRQGAESEPTPPKVGEDRAKAKEHVLLWSKFYVFSQIFQVYYLPNTSCYSLQMSQQVVREEVR